VGGGAEWRFTMHVYPLYIVAAIYAVAGVWRAVQAVGRDRSLPVERPAPSLRARAAAVIVVGGVAAAGYVALPWLVVREAVAAGESTSIETGGRDWVFYREGWTSPHSNGNVTVRVGEAERAIVWLPLPERRRYDLVLRLDPVGTAPDQHVTVLLNGQLIGRLRLTWDPTRVGSYRIPLPEGAVRAGRNELALVPEVRIPASQAGPRFEWVEPSAQIGMALWYVRVLP
jgi:hypothetical protein